MRNKILTFITALIIIGCCGEKNMYRVKYDGKFEKEIRKGFRKWEKNTFFIEKYIVVVENFEYTKWEKYVPNRKYIEVRFLSENLEQIPFDKMVLDDIHNIKKGDTIVKPSFTDSLYVIKDRKQIKLNYRWRWNMKEKIL